MVAPTGLVDVLRRRGRACHRRFCRAQHIFNEDPVAASGIAHQHVRDSADKLAVLNDGAAAQ